MSHESDTIVAPATALAGALAIVRLSGPDALAVCDRIFRGRTRPTQAAAGTLHYGRIVEPGTTARTDGTSMDSTAAPQPIASAYETTGNQHPAATQEPKRDSDGETTAERTVDDVMIAVFRAPHSYTGEDAAEISCHGSSYIVSEILRLAIGAGARMARPGEFTERAFLAGRMDLAQAEAVADLIAASSRSAHALASAQMRGSYSAALHALRDRLVKLMSLLELELDFSEEEVEFADRDELRDTMQRIGTELERLRDSFALGNALKRGVAVALVGSPNVGKSTLLNQLVGEERAMVSELPGTTRDAIEATVTIDGVLFRFIDTAGMRDTEDRLERMGIERTRAAISRAQIIVRLIDAAAFADPAAASEHAARLRTNPLALAGEETFGTPDGNRPPSRSASCSIPDDNGTAHDAADSAGSRSLQLSAPNVSDAKANILRAEAPDRREPPRNEATVLGETPLHRKEHSNNISDEPESVDRPMRRRTLFVANKMDLHPGLVLPDGFIPLSARNGEGIDRLRSALRAAVETDALQHGDPIVSSARHYEALVAARTALGRALAGLDTGLPTDLLGEELRTVRHHLGTITGEITSDEILSNIFSNFCIGK